jgi:hypothetical protein
LLFNLNLYRRGYKLNGHWKSALFSSFYVAPDSLKNIGEELAKADTDFSYPPTPETYHVPQWWLKVNFLVVTRAHMFIANITGYYGYKGCYGPQDPKRVTERFLLKTSRGTRQCLVYEAREILLLEPLPVEHEVLVCGSDVTFVKIKAICEHSRFLKAPSALMLQTVYAPENSLDKLNQTVLCGNYIPLSTLAVAWVKSLWEAASITIKPNGHGTPFLQHH